MPYSACAIMASVVVLPEPAGATTTVSGTCQLPSMSALTRVRHNPLGGGTRIRAETIGSYINAVVHQGHLGAVLDPALSRSSSATHDARQSVFGKRGRTRDNTHGTPGSGRGVNLTQRSRCVNDPEKPESSAVV